MNRFIRICKYFVDRYESKLKAKRLADEINIKLQAKAEMSSFVEQKGEAFKKSLEEQQPLFATKLGNTGIDPKPGVIKELNLKRNETLYWIDIHVKEPEQLNKVLIYYEGEIYVAYNFERSKFITNEGSEFRFKDVEYWMYLPLDPRRVVVHGLVSSIKV